MEPVAQRCFRWFEIAIPTGVDPTQLERSFAAAFVDAAQPGVEFRWLRADAASTAMLLIEAETQAQLDECSRAPLRAWLDDQGWAEPPTTTRRGVVTVVAGPGPGPGPGQRSSSSVQANAARACDDPVARFAAQVRASGRVWGLYHETWARSAAAGGREALPFWSRRDEAAACVRGEWSEYAARAVELGDFIAQWLVGMAEDSIVVILGATGPGDGGQFDPRALAVRLSTRDSD